MSTIGSNGAARIRTVLASASEIFHDLASLDPSYRIESLIESTELVILQLESELDSWRLYTPSPDID